MPETEQIISILDYIRLHESTHTTHQMMNHFESNGLDKFLVFAFPFMVRGHVLAFETLLSKEILKRYELERPELPDRDIIEAMMTSNSRF